MSKTQGTEIAHKLIQTQHDVNKNGLDYAMQHVIQPLIEKIDSLHDKVDTLSKTLDSKFKEPVHMHDWRFLEVDRLKVLDRHDSDLESECSQQTPDSDDSGHVIVCMPGGNVEPRSKGNRTGHLPHTDLNVRARQVTAISCEPPKQKRVRRALYYEMAL